MSIAKAILDTKFIHRSSVKKKDVTYLEFSKETTHAWVTLDFGRQTDAIPLPSFDSYGFIAMWTETIFTAGNNVHLNAAHTLLVPFSLPDACHLSCPNCKLFCGERNLASAPLILNCWMFSTFCIYI
ncbi:hypothetical protein NECAME_04281, partial [Necator americanus]